MTPLVQSAGPVTLLGGGPVAALELALARAPRLVAADGGADAALAAGIEPEAVIGDFDSLSDVARARLADRLHHVAEQDSTDFEKCLRRIAAPLILACGFAGGRMDHLMAVMNVLVRLPACRTVVLGPQDACVLAPPEISLDLAPGTPVSLFPMAPVTAESDGLTWPVAGLQFAPGGQSGTSNRTKGPVRLITHAPAMLLFVPLDALDALIAGLDAAPAWDAFAGAARPRAGYTRSD